VSGLPRTPDFSLAGRRALVTGGSKGLGLAAAAALAQYGAAVTLVARHAADLEPAAEAITAAGGQADTLPLDVSDPDAVSAALARRSAFDVLVNNAGTNRPAKFVDVTVLDFDAIFGLNVRSAFFVAQAVARRMLSESRRGSIINMSSQMGHVGAARRSVYCASKHAIEGLTKAMAIELGAAGIRVNSICPTFVETPMTEPYFRDAGFRDEVLSKIKLGRLGKVEDVMGAVVYLASDASALVTGTALRVDGGWTAE
jgi:NAD(P)-dependent dehydrogenase (short-subunit alcohol dehydrogenase family)